MKDIIILAELTKDEIPSAQYYQSEDGDLKDLGIHPSGDTGIVLTPFFPHLRAGGAIILATLDHEKAMRITLDSDGTALSSPFDFNSLEI